MRETPEGFGKKRENQAESKPQQRAAKGDNRGARPGGSAGPGSARGRERGRGRVGPGRPSEQRGAVRNQRSVLSSPTFPRIPPLGNSLICRGCVVLFPLAIFTVPQRANTTEATTTFARDRDGAHRLLLRWCSPAMYSPLQNAMYSCILSIRNVLMRIGPGAMYSCPGRQEVFTP